MIAADPAHYVVFHPENKRIRTAVLANALINGRPVDGWSGSVWLDRPPGNEDPFVLGPTWLYSYCHATQLCRTPIPGRSFVTEGSCILFCSGDFANRGVLAVDTVFWVAQGHRWASANQPPSRFASDGERTEAWKFNLRFGGMKNGHKGQYTYEAALYPAEPYSHLPLSQKGDRVEVALRELSAPLRQRIVTKVDGKRPVLLADKDLDAILRFIKARTAVEVVGNIAAKDSEFSYLRQEPDRGCQPCVPENC